MALNRQKYEIEESDLANLPFFYRFVIYNELFDEGTEVTYNKKTSRLKSIIYNTPPDRLLSQIINLEELKDE
jgi:hypothetical protein